MDLNSRSLFVTPKIGRLNSLITLAFNIMWRDLSSKICRELCFLIAKERFTETFTDYIIL